MGVSSVKSEYKSFYDLLYPEQARRRERAEMMKRARQYTYKQTEALEHNAINREAQAREEKRLERELEFEAVKQRYSYDPGVSTGELSALELNFLRLEEAFENVEVNKDRTAPYFRTLAEEKGSELYDVADNVEHCYENWQFDVYRGQRVKDLKRVLMCHNKFCPNCQKMIQASRLYRFSPEIEALRGEYDVYHLTLTVPNVFVPSDESYLYTKLVLSYLELATVRAKKAYDKAVERYISASAEKTSSKKLKKLEDKVKSLTLTEDQMQLLEVVEKKKSHVAVLPATLDRMFQAFSRLIKYFSGNSETLGITENFEAMGYGGAIRNLELVYKGVKVDSESGEYVREYHPHIHAILLLKKDLNLDKHLKNQYSFDRNGKSETLFSPEEILIQKVWRLIYDGERVTSSAVEKLGEGYSCKLDNVGDRIYEAFKYAIKLDKKTEFTYEVFRDYYHVLYRRRCFQGYGKLYNIVGDDEIIEDVVDKYTEIIARLQLVEDPREEWSSMDYVKRDVDEGKYTFISKRAIYQALTNYKIPRMYEEIEDEI